MAPVKENREQEMRDTVNSQYDSFLYWRMPIPELDLSELEHLGLADMVAYKSKGGYGSFTAERKKQNCNISDGEDDGEDTSLLQFNSFNFWRAPIPCVGSLDFDLI
ncbi:protein AF1q isoform X1 [Zootoca vivipara]|uniref:protein AF1q isoform X1 n=2 Tax=Zootoca vivipara TaxID=8524 RepID=UPI00293B9F8D|nr:protein AF1q isoform X1 [Zootoca vivipara]